MKHIILTINESITRNISDSIYLNDGSKTLYRETTTNIDDLFNNIQDFETIEIEIKDELKQILSKIEHKEQRDITFVYNKNNRVFKIPYVFTDAIETVIKDYNKEYGDKYKYKYFGKKIKVYRTNFGQVFETGNGSIKSITTAEQETAFCEIWNKLCENDVELTSGWVKTIIGDLANYVDNDWIHTWTTTANAIIGYLSGAEKNPKDYIAVRVGDNKNSIGEKHNQFVHNYAKRVVGKSVKKDIFDPSDVILYYKPKETNIKKTLGELIEGINKIDVSATSDIKQQYYDGLVGNFIYVPISLKKLSSKNKHNISILNCTVNSGGTGSVNKFMIHNMENKNQINVMCTCNLCFNGLTDENGEEITSVHMVNVTMRSFDKNNSVDIDVTLNHKNIPTLGKCPRETWRKYLNLTKSNKMEDSLAAFNEFLSTKEEKEVKSALKDIIQGAIKQGPNCLPFILIH